MCRTMGSQLALPVAILHAFAFGLGYWMCRLLGFNEKTARTVSIETGAALTARQLSVLHAAFCVVISLASGRRAMPAPV